MRDSIARALTWALQLIFPARGKRRAVPPAPGHRPETVAAWSRPWTGPSAADARAIFHAEETQAMTPDQRERWWAAAFAEIGVEYGFVPDTLTGAYMARAAA